ncbi:MAG: MMPL family transporter, partial [Chloroflexota bacterium]
MKNGSPLTQSKKFHPVPWLGKLVTGPRGRWVVLLVWIILTGLLSSLPPTLASLYDNNLLYDIGDQESVQGTRLLAREFPEQRNLPAIIVFHNPSGLNDSDYAKAKQIGEWLVSKDAPVSKQGQAQVVRVVSIFTLPQARSELVSANGTTMSMVVPLNSSPADGSLTETIKEIRKYTDSLNGSGSSLQVKVSGPGGVIADTQLIFTNTDLTLLLSTVAIVLVLLIVIYRSPVLALLPLVVVGLTQSVVGGLLALGIKAEFLAVSQMASSIMTILLFGAGTDYTIFLVSRYREELHSEPDRLLALRNAFNNVAGAILSSAGTVIVALLALALATLGIYNSLGSALALALVVMLLAGLTLVPALLAILGRFAFWPFHPKPIPAGSAQTKTGFWSWVARWVAHHPKAAVGCSTLFL